MKLAVRLKTLRRKIGISQEAVGAQGFVTAAGWIKIENGRRQASEKIIRRLVHWLVDENYVPLDEADALLEELLTLRYLGSRSCFVREMAMDHAAKLPNGTTLIANSSFDSPMVRERRGRPRASH